MKNRMNMQEIQPAAFNAMMVLESYLSGTSLTKTQKDLLKIRASQINSCAFCINMHTKDALNNGETNQRIFLLNAWRETDLFNDKEKVLLAITEEITLIHHKGLSDATYSEAKAVFSEVQIAEIIMAVVTINAWNRITISTRIPVSFEL